MTKEEMIKLTKELIESSNLARESAKIVLLTDISESLQKIAGCVVEDGHGQFFRFERLPIKND